MIRKMLVVAIALGGAAVAGAQAPTTLTVTSALEKVTADAGCKRTGADFYTLFTCDKGLTYWFFTREGTPEHPGFMWRGAYQDKGAWLVETRGQSDGSDAQQPAFKAWMDRIARAIE